MAHPTRVARMSDSRTLIAEEIGFEKQVPFRFECRTLIVDADGRSVFDSTLFGMDDAFGCAMADGRIALLRRTQWELQVIDRDGSIEQSIGLSRFSKKMPRFASWTDRGTFLIVFYNRSFDVDLIEIDGEGRLLWYLPPNGACIGIIGSAQLLPGDTLLIADPFRHVVLELDRTGETVWSFGEAGHPSAAEDRLSSPSSAVDAGNGRRFVADTRNHRVMVIEPEGRSRPLCLCDTGLSDPTFVVPLAGGRCLIADTGNARVIETDSFGCVTRRFGAELEQWRTLSYPRSVDALTPNRYLVADTAHDRIVTLEDDRITEWPFQGAQPLFWPRCVRRQPSGRLLVADARNGRIIEVDTDGSVTREVASLRGGAGSEFHDPHDVRPLPNGHLLVTDSTNNLVLEVDWSGHVHRVIGGERAGLVLDDPHSALQLADGTLLISDTGHHRIVHADAEGRLLREFLHVTDETHCCRLHQPRYVDAIDGNVMAIADTGNNRILAATMGGTLLWQFDVVPDSDRSFLDQPRWVRLIGPNEIIVCDHFHHRIVHVRRRQNDSKPPNV